MPQRLILFQLSCGFGPQYRGADSLPTVAVSLRLGIHNLAVAAVLPDAKSPSNMYVVLDRQAFSPLPGRPKEVACAGEEDNSVAKPTSTSASSSVGIIEGSHSFMKPS